MKKLKQIVPEDNQTIAEREYTEPIIPEDLLIDIFSRVPSSKYVARFRCLSKSWESILVGPYFTELFLTKSSYRPRRLLFTAQRYDKLLFFSTPQTPNSSVVATCYKTHSHLHEVASSLLHHGLVCCTDGKIYNPEPVICNPATGELLTLPKPNTGLKNQVIYCGYDPTEKNFKLLCIAAYKYSNRAWVLTVETGNFLWRMIQCKYHSVPFSQGHRMICIDGVLYYLAFTDSFSPMDSVMVCFDVKSEKFSFINIYYQSMRRHGTSLINYMGRLGVVQFTDTTQRTIRLWLLEEDAAGTGMMIKKWSINIYELPLSWKHPCSCNEEFQIVGMTRGTCDIVLSPRKFSDPFYVFYYNVERKTLVGRSEIQGLQELKRQRPPVYIFQDYIEDLKLMKSLYN